MTTPKFVKCILQTKDGFYRNEVFRFPSPHCICTYTHPETYIDYAIRLEMLPQLDHINLRYFCLIKRSEDGKHAYYEEA